MQKVVSTHEKYKRLLIRNTRLSFVAYHIGLALTLCVLADQQADYITTITWFFLTLVYIPNLFFFAAIMLRKNVSIRFTRRMLSLQMVVWMLIFIPWDYVLGEARSLALILSFFAVHYLFLYVRFRYSALIICYITTVHLTNTYVAINYFGADNSFYPELINTTGFLLAASLIALHSSHVGQKIRDAGAKDPLTQLPNRKHFLRLLEEEEERCRRYEQPACLLMLDVDYFKQINDRFGHDMGDRVLVALAKSITDQLRITDYACRWGGEEFLILLTHTQMAQAQLIADRLRNAIGDQVTGALNHQVAVTVSGGLSRLHASESVHQAITVADDHLYQAKAAGRNQICAPEPEVGQPQLAGANPQRPR